MALFTALSPLGLAALQHSSTTVKILRTGGNPHFFCDDNTWADADSNYFYFAWCDRSRTWSNTFNGQPYTRPDADVRFAKIKQ